MCIERRQRGLTLVELIVFILIVGVALAGILTVMNVTVKSSADPLIRKQMLAIAEALMEEVQMQPFTWCDPTDANVATATSHSGCAAPTLQEKLGSEGSGVPTRITTSTQPMNNVSDYSTLAGAALSGTLHGLGTTTTPIKSITNNASITAPVGYYATVGVSTGNDLGPAGNLISGTALPTELLPSVMLITVTVFHGSENLVLHGYRTRYAPNATY